MDQQQQPQQPTSDPSMAAANGANGLNGLPPMDANGNFLQPDAMQGLMNGHGMIPGMDGSNFMPDPSMLAAMGNQHLGMPVMPANGHQPAQVTNGVSADEIALYDRQIRLWGVDAQAKIQSANILLITIKALANEIAKNLVLSGVGSLTILDDGLVTEYDLGAQFFLSEADPQSLIGQNRAQAAAAAIQKLNPRVKVHVDTDGVTGKGASYFGGFDVVIATDLQPDNLSLINTATRVYKRAFYAASTHGLYGYIFNDLIEHDFVITREQGNRPAEANAPETRTRSIVSVATHKEGPKTIEKVTKKELYSTWLLASDGASLPEEYLKSKRRLRSVTPALSCLQALWEFTQMSQGRMPGNRDDLKEFTRLATQKHKALSLPHETLTPEFLRSFLQNLGSEVAPVTAILGGQLAQDVINVLSQKEQPIQNMVVFDGEKMEALMVPLHPQGLLGQPQLEGGGMMGGAPDMSMGGMGFDPSMAAFPGGMPMGMDGMSGFPQQGIPMGMNGQGMNGAQMDGQAATFQAPIQNTQPQEEAPPQAQAQPQPANPQPTQDVKPEEQASQPQPNAEATQTQDAPPTQSEGSAPQQPATQQ